MKPPGNSREAYTKRKISETGGLRRKNTQGKQIRIRGLI
jgi:hypothetical protein